MSKQDLETYVNDHLAGSEVALTLLDEWSRRDIEIPWKLELSALHDDIAEDRESLRRLMAKRNLTESTWRKVGGKAGGTLLQGRIRFLAPFKSDRILLESLDLVVCGIFGKRALWKALAVATEAQGDRGDHALLTTLVERAEDQIARAEAVRLELVSFLVAPEEHSRVEARA